MASGYADARTPAAATAEATVTVGDRRRARVLSCSSGMVWLAYHASVRPLGRSRAAVSVSRSSSRPMNVSDAAAELHERTKHTWPRILAESQGRDWSNHPLPFKIYPDLEPLWLPRELPESSVPATEVLAGHVSAPASALDLAGLTRLLFFSAGVTRFLQGVLFRAAPSAGALYPTEVYVVCGPLADLPAGVYHFE